VIRRGEEPRLGRERCLPRWDRRLRPLHRGSRVEGLEISILRDHTVGAGRACRWTVRLMTTLELPGGDSSGEGGAGGRYVRALLESKLGPRPNLGESIRWRLGNAESWRMSRRPAAQGLQTMELALLRERLPDILRRGPCASA